ncbi:putative thiol-disulfide interchange protein [Chlamydiales bacterium STE3]|nr:putative thiol-disulfide interchange protein [Chlamydiales bacterium STE3]
MLKQIIYFCFVLVSCFNTISIEAQELSSPESPAHITLFAEKQAITTNDSFWVSLQFTLEDSWHAYWKNPGDAGMAPSIDWQLPDGFRVERVEWPVPQKFEKDEAVTFGYNGTFELLALLKTPTDLKAVEELEIGTNVHWVLCSEDTCMPGESESKLTLPVNLASAPFSEHAVRIQQALAKKPKPLDGSAYYQDAFVHFEFPGSLAVPAVKPFFFPEASGVDYHKDPFLKVSLDQTKNHRISLMVDDEPKLLKGLLVMGDDVWEVETPVVKKQPEMLSQADVFFMPSLNVPSEENQVDFGPFILALGCAFLGGMILNLMPCVLPVVSFKIMSFVKLAGQERLTVFKHGLAFALGVLLSFWTLAGVLMLLKAYGHAVGWGFQLQEPFFVAVLATLLLIFGLSQFGVFEFGTSFASYAGDAHIKTVKKEGYSVSLMSGVFATAVATPCTGPFLGSAVGYAITLPPIFGMIIFTSLGLGMAFPYVALSAFPKLLRWMPKPGAWMDAFKQFMGFLMMATVLWLGWVFGAQTSENAIFILLGALLVISLGCWIYGKWGTPLQRKKVRMISYTLTLGCLLVASFMIREALHSVDVRQGVALSGQGDKLGWEPFSQARIDELKANNIPFLIDFTAKWCLICQANHVVLNKQEVERKLDEMGVVRIKADWTRNDPTITAELRKFGRSSVPLYVLYGTNESQDPVILPQVLTADNVISSLKLINASSNVSSLH